MTELNPEIINTISEEFTKDGLDSELAKAAAIVAYHAATSFVDDKTYQLCKRTQNCSDCNPLMHIEMDA